MKIVAVLCCALVLMLAHHQQVAADVSSCSFEVNGQSYDLSPAITASGGSDYKVSGASGGSNFDYYFNLCQPVVGSHNCQSASVAQLTLSSSGVCRNLAAANTVPTVKPGSMSTFPLSPLNMLPCLFPSLCIRIRTGVI
jgi:hypothetical protein